MKKTLLALALALSGASAMAQQVTLKISHVTQADSPKNAGALKFKELAEKYTSGSVRVEVYTNSSLFGDREEMDALKNNKVQMLAPSLSKMNAFYKDPADNPWTVFDMPFLFSSLDDLITLEKSTVYDEMNASLKGEAAFVFGIWDNGLTYLSTPQAINTYEDLAKLKVRVQPSEILKQSFKAIGAKPRVLAYNELYAGTFYGAVNSSANPPSNTVGSNLMPMQKYLYKTNNNYLGYVVLMNRAFWEGLTAQQREQLTKAMKETRGFQVEAANLDNAFAVENIQRKGLTRVVDLDPKILEKMKKNSVGVVTYLSPLQKTYYNKIRAVISKKP